MTPFQERLSPLTKRMAEDMMVRNLSPSTIDSYTYRVDKFLEYFGQPAEQLGPAQVREYQLYVIKEKKIGWSNFNQLVCSLRFLYRFTIPREWHVKMIPFGKRPKKLPPTNPASVPVGARWAKKMQYGCSSVPRTSNIEPCC